MRIYISGKITGVPIEEAITWFNYHSNYIGNKGHQTVNPMALPHKHNQSWESFMKEDIAALMGCDGIYMIHGWKKSKGARLEYELAERLGIEIFLFQIQIPNICNDF